MKQKAWVFYSLSAAGLLGLVLGRTVAAIWPVASTTEQERLLLGVMRLVQDRYVSEIQEDRLVYDALHAVLGSLDEYSRFYEPHQLTQLEEDTSGKYAGVGFVADPYFDDRLIVDYPFPESPALRAGLQPGDEIIAIEDLKVSTLDREKAIEKIRGEPHTFVTMTIKRLGKDEPFEVRLERQTIRNPAIVDARRVDDQIAYLWVETFDPSMIEEFDRAMTELKADGVRGLILDLRFNGGGTVEAAVDLANRFIGEGLLAKTKGRYQEADEREYRAQADRLHHPDLPLVVLVNEHTASASEIFAGAIQDHRRGILVGTRTFGKGVIQSLLSLPRSNVAVKLTTAAYYTPAGRAIERSIGVQDTAGRRGGLLPDVIVPIEEEAVQHLWRQRLWKTIPESVRDEAIARYRKRAKDAAAFESVEDAQLAAGQAVLRGDPVYSKLVPRAAREVPKAPPQEQHIDSPVEDPSSRR